MLTKLISFPLHESMIETTAKIRFREKSLRVHSFLSRILPLQHRNVSVETAPSDAYT